MSDDQVNTDREELRKKLTKQFYMPEDVAALFGISTDALKSRRQRGQIRPTIYNSRTTVYSAEDILAADLSPRKRGPKPRKQRATESDLAARYAYGG